ncbi:protealysin propeptide domain-containing protein [Xenorhabdus khoisanae]|uniref:Protealysin N-terminal propeptide domain-containing protein n=1 Tax=Xenorhabdus khoisanae TaxID=880157 RepID=A0A0J5FLS7_9GAMM|nr:protealysin propeptide domain-containing protein [Xenorhabdus khoisanae]KMJ43248.1 hypothetical protein AB204_20775 [Xenorhabdus khoisanae]
MNSNQINKKNIIPPYLLECIAKNCDTEDKEFILKTLDHVNQLMKHSPRENKPHANEDNSSLYNDKILPK